VNRCLTALFAVLLAAMGSNGRAENLVDIFELAVKGDPRLLAARAERDAVKEVGAQSRANYLPTIKANVTFTKLSEDIKSYQFLGEDYDTFLDRKPEETVLGRYLYENKGYSVILSQPVFHMPNFANGRIADAEQVKADVTYRIAQQDLLFRVAEHYYGVLARIDDLNYARGEKAAIAKQLDVTKKRFQVGLTAVTDVHEAQARHDLAVAREVIAENELSHARELLRDVTGILHIDLLGLRADMPFTPPTPSNIDDWTTAARSQNLRIGVAQLEVEEAGYRVDKEKAAHYPTVDINGALGYNSYGYPFGASEAQVASVTLDMSWTIYQGGRTASNIRQARSYAEVAKRNLERTEREVLSETRNAFLGVLASMSQVKAFAQAVNSSAGAAKATEAGFEAGTRSAIEVIDAKREQVRAQRDYASTRYDYLLNTLRLKAAVGLLTIDDLEQLNHWLE